MIINRHRILPLTRILSRLPTLSINSALGFLGVLMLIWGHKNILQYIRLLRVLGDDRLAAAALAQERQGLKVSSTR